MKLKILIKILELPLYFLSGFIPKKNVIIFGAWNGDKFGDNSAYLMEYLKSQHSPFELIWIGNESSRKTVPEGITFIEKDTWDAFKKSIRAKYVFITHSISDVSSINIFRNAKVVQLWHGVGIKSLDSIQEHGLFSGLRSLIRKILRNYDYFVASSKENARRTIDVFSTYGANENNILTTGFPRNDYFFKETFETHQIKKDMSKQLNTDISDKNIILYMPTFRLDSDERFSFLSLEETQRNKLQMILEEHNAIIIEKAHDSEAKDKVDSEKLINQSIFPIFNDEHIDVQDILVASDVLVTDYSSVYLDFVLLDRPVIHFTYDYEKYINENKGVYYDFDKISGGDLVFEFDELLKSICLNLENKDFNKESRRQAKTQMLEFEHGTSSENIAEYFNLFDKGDK